MAAQAPLRPGSALVLVRATQRCRPASARGQPHTTRPNERWMSLVRYHVPLHWKLREGFRDLMESRRPISRVLSVLMYASVSQHRTVIPLGVQSPTRSSSLPATRRLATSLRDGSSLAAYLALLRLGFTEPPSLPKARWALTPPFHPYRSIGCPMTRRFAFCCTVRHTKLTPHVPRRYLAVYPVEPGLSSVSELAPRHRDHPAGDQSMSIGNITSQRTPRRAVRFYCERIHHIATQ